MRIQSATALLMTALVFAGTAHAQYLQASQGAIVDNSVAPVPSPSAPQATGQKYETVSGGVTGEERGALDAEQRGKSVKLVFAATNGEYLGDVTVVIKTAKGEEVSNFKADGPYVFIALPAGTYMLTASTGVETRNQKITAGKMQKSYTIRFSPQ